MHYALINLNAIRVALCQLRHCLAQTMTEHGPHSATLSSDDRTWPVCVVQTELRFICQQQVCNHVAYSRLHGIEPVYNVESRFPLADMVDSK